MGRKYRNPIPKEFNVGPVIRAAMRQKGATQTILGRKTDRSPVTVMNLLKRRSIQASIVYEFSMAMEVDLFHELSRCLPEHIRKDERKAEVEELTAEILRLRQALEAADTDMARNREDNAYLKKMIDILAKDR
jgi:hypothetical protein